jgi:aerobic carbon-monoxide dehydrogenase medium subunit
VLSRSDLIARFHNNIKTRVNLGCHMIARAFDYAIPKTLSEAVGLLKGNQGAKVMAGGQSLIPLMKLRIASPALVVDINRIPGLEYIRESDGFLRIGALTRMADVESSDLLKRKYPIIQDASLVVADPLVRNLGTVGGNISHGDPENDLPAVMLALDAEFVAIGPDGERTFKARSFFTDTFSTALGHDDILTEVRVPSSRLHSGGSYLKLEQKVADFAIAGAGVQLTIGPTGVCETVGIGLTAVGPTALEAKDAETALMGKKPTGEEVARVAQMAAEASDPVSDIRGTAEYKRKVVKVLVAKAIGIAHNRASSGGSV